VTHTGSCAQVAIVWTRARSPVIHPIIGARRLDQILDNLGAADLDLPAETVARLDTQTRMDLGFPAAFIRDTSAWVFGAAVPEGTRLRDRLPGCDVERFGMGPAVVLGQDLSEVAGPVRDRAVADLAVGDRKLGNGHREAAGR
jgi:Aldo/keto reductase family